MVFEQVALLDMRIRHRHDDGTWGTFEPRPHDVAEHDPERTWGTATIYACTTCDEEVLVDSTQDPTGDRPA